MQLGGFRTAWRVAFLATVPWVVGSALGVAPIAAATAVDCASQDLQHAIDNAPTGATLLVKGTCKGNFVVNRNLVLQGNPKATLDGRSFDSVITQNKPAHLRLVDLTITHGAADFGGGISDNGGRLDLLRVKVIDNIAVARTDLGAGGGGIFASGPFTLSNSLVAGNAAYARFDGDADARGGGMYVQSSPDASVTIASSVIRDNRAVARGGSDVPPGGLVEARAFGGGIEAENGTWHVTDSHVDGNLVLVSDPGTTIAFGGGIHVNNFFDPDLASVTVVRSSVSNNVVESTVVESNDPDSNPALAGGGGVYGERNSSVYTAFRSAVVAGNRVSASGDRAEAEGGGVFTESGPVPLSVSSSFSANVLEAHAGGDAAIARGGGLDHQAGAEGGSTSIDRTKVDANRIVATSFFGAEASGGGVFTVGSLSIVRSTLSRNDADGTGFLGALASGGGLKAHAGGPQHVQHVVNSTVSGNTVSAASKNGEADAFGGGVDVDDLSSTSASYSTIARNAVAATGHHPVARGGGVHVSSGKASVTATILALNIAPSGRNCSGTVSTGGHNLFGSLAGCTISPLADKVTTDPKLGPLTGNGGPTETIALLSGSPAINAIAAAACKAPIDQRGVKRPQPQGGRCDIGSFEKKA